MRILLEDVPSLFKRLKGFSRKLGVSRKDLLYLFERLEKISREYALSGYSVDVGILREAYGLIVGMGLLHVPRVIAVKQGLHSGGENVFVHTSIVELIYQSWAKHNDFPLDNDILTAIRVHDFYELFAGDMPDDMAFNRRQKKENEDEFFDLLEQHGIINTRTRSLLRDLADQNRDGDGYIIYVCDKIAAPIAAAINCVIGKQNYTAKLPPWRLTEQDRDEIASLDKRFGWHIKYSTYLLWLVHFVKHNIDKDGFCTKFAIAVFILLYELKPDGDIQRTIDILKNSHPTST